MKKDRLINIVNVRHKITIGWLYIFYKLTQRCLQLRFLSKPDTILFSGTPFTLYWKADGCFKVIINHTIVLPGNITSVDIDSAGRPSPLLIQFYGYQQTIAKTFNIKPLRVHTKKYALSVAPEPEFIELKPNLNRNVYLHTGRCKTDLPLPVMLIPRFRVWHYSHSVNLSTPSIQLDPFPIPKLLN